LLSQQSEGDIDWGQLGKGAAAVAGIALDVALSFFS